MFIYLLTGLARHSSTHDVLDTILDGRIAEATSTVSGFLRQDGGASGLARAELTVLAADLLLAQGRDEEAEEMYRVAVKRASAGARGQVRIVSCRNTGFLSLFQQRYATAAHCLQRVAEDLSAENAQRVEAMCGLATATHGTGLTQKALQILQEASTLAGPAQSGSAPLSMLVDLVRAELLVQREVRSQRSLGDHVFWQTPMQTVGADASSTPSAREAIAACIADHGHHALVLRRLHYLEALLHAAQGSAAAMVTLPQHVAAMRQSNLFTCERQGRLDSALAAVAIGNADFARALLEPLCMRGGSGPAQRWTFELSYCMAKMCELTGRTAESLMHYQRYTMESLQCVRTECHPEASVRPGSPGESPARDDIEMSLPARYRRAYRFLIANLDRSTLTVREVAEHIGVTERALQNVFRKHVGMTPAEVIRRRRVEHIRDDLLAEQVTGQTVLEAGARWGIRNRSTLVNSYRRHFDETPGQTLQRQRAAEAPSH
jgi:AraC-like DNA-binding protein